jgi:hypothetical protein
VRRRRNPDDVRLSGLSTQEIAKELRLAGIKCRIEYAEDDSEDDSIVVSKLVAIQVTQNGECEVGREETEGDPDYDPDDYAVWTWPPRRLLSSLLGDLREALAGGTPKGQR